MLIFQRSICILLSFQPFQRWLLTRRDPANCLQIITTTSQTWITGGSPQSARQCLQKDPSPLPPNYQPRRRPKPLCFPGGWRRPRAGQPCQLTSLSSRPESPRSNPTSHQSQRLPPDDPRRPCLLPSRQWTTASRGRSPNREAMCTVRVKLLVSFQKPLIEIHHKNTASFLRSFILSAIYILCKQSL